MKILISPAKSLDFDKKPPTELFSNSLFLKESEKINQILKKKSPKKLSTLMGISEKLANLNWKRNQEWLPPFNISNAKQAIYAFNGDVYLGLDAYSISKKNIPVLQNKVRILSGLYGLLKPLDLIQPYRLEMSTKLKIDNKENLYQFWRETLTKSINKELNNQEPIINLASNEYSKVIDQKILKSNIITPVFKEFRHEKYKTIAFLAKKARGQMTRFAIDNHIDNPENLKTFDIDSYSFNEPLSNNNTWVFTRS